MHYHKRSNSNAAKREGVVREFVHGAKPRAGFDKVVLMTRKTRLAGLIERFNTLAQAKFYIEHAGGNFQEYQLEDEAYRQSADVVRRSIEVGLASPRARLADAIGRRHFQ
jgi:hypothetical protein